MNEGEDWFTVEVPLERVATNDPARLPRVQLNQDVLDFVQTHDSVSYSHNPGNILIPGSRAFEGWTITFRFIDKPTAMLFKLTYGGH